MKRAVHTNSAAIDTRHVDVLDGVRALAILIILWFHLWQQSWLMPHLHLPDWLVLLGLPHTVSLDFIPRSGFLFVDMMLLLSAFCLFLPHARAVFCGKPVPDIGQFYKKRLARIIPPYYLSVLLIFFFVALPGGAYASPRALCVDLFATLTFTQTFIPDVLLSTKLNGVLWTAAIEMQFYLLFPLLARCFRKRPLLTYAVMVSISMAYLQLFALGNPDGLRVTLNQLPGFFGVFANGMLAAYGFVWLSARTQRRNWIAALATAAAFLCLYWIVCLEKAAPRVSPVQLWQAANRYQLSAAFTLFLLSAALSARWFRFLFSNRLMTFLAGISYNVYIWHQWLAVKCKEWRIPYWTGEQPPNMTGDLVWQRQYTFLVLLSTLAVAVLLTYCFERPVSRALLRIPFPRRVPAPTSPPENADDISILDPDSESERTTVMHHEYTPHGVCSTRISFDLTETGTLHHVAFQSGCNGNLKAIGKLVEGKDAKETADLLRGNTCDGGPTSCADQLARAIDEALAENA